VIDSWRCDIWMKMMLGKEVKYMYYWILKLLMLTLSYQRLENILIRIRWLFVLMGWEGKNQYEMKNVMMLKY